MRFQPYGGPRCRVISDNDYCGDPDGLVQLVHQLLSPSADLRAIIGSRLPDGDGLAPSPDSATLSHERVVEVLSIMERDVAAYAGSNAGLADAETPQPSAGAEAIVAEAMRTDTDLPLYATFGGGLTELASAYLMEPRIADRLTAIWIGGREHPDLAPPPPDTPSSRYVVRPAPYVDLDGAYQPRAGGRPIRVYTHLDIRLMMADLYAKLALAA